MVLPAVAGEQVQRAKPKVAKIKKDAIVFNRVTNAPVPL